MKNDVICDASSLISLSDSCLLDTLRTVREHLDGSFYISPEVEYECISHPTRIKEYALPALRLRDAVQSGVITLLARTRATTAGDILDLANNVFSINGRPLKILQAGEADMLALAKDLEIMNILIDERTTRLLIEAPLDLHKHFEAEFHKAVRINDDALSRFRKLTNDMSIFRSSEIVVMAYELGHFDRYAGMQAGMLEAALYAIKFAGCGISFEEIEEYMKGLKK